MALPADLKAYYSVLDISCTAVTSQRGLHVLIGDMAKQLGGSIVFYTAEDPDFMARQYTLKARLNKAPAIDGIVFFRLRQFNFGTAFDFPFMRDLLASGYELHFAREQFSIPSLDALDAAYPEIYAFQFEERGATDGYAFEDLSGFVSGH